MNHNVPDGNMGNDPRSIHDLLSHPNQKKSTGGDQDLMELLWRNGHVVMHSQTHRKSPTSVNEFRQANRPEPASKCGLAFESPSNSIQADETISWFQYPLDYTLDKDFCSEFFYEMPMSHTVDTDKLNKNVVDDNNVLLQPISKQSTLCLQESLMPPPNTHAVNLENGRFVNFSHFSRPVRPDLVPARGPVVERVLESRIQKEAGESSSIMTIGSSGCGSNQVQNRPNQSHTLSNDATGVFASGSKEDVQKKYADTYETTVTSSSGASGSSFGRTEQKSGSDASHKRKGRDGEESDCHSQEGEYESVEANRPAQQSASARRSRAAEVHNLSERRRRDRINEKMRALQQLIPHCNKTDKASMLDEAIEYLKSLQLQVQLMWMGGGMTPMMFPGVQHYMSRMGMGMSHATMPSFHGPVPIPRVPLVNQSMPSAPTTNLTPMCHPLTFNPLNFPNQMQNAPLPENYAQFLSFRHMQPPSQPYGSHMVQQSLTLIPSSSSQPTEGGGLPGNIQAGRSS